MQQYRNMCDVCEKETQGYVKHDYGTEEYKRIAKNNWDLSIHNSWLDSINDSDLLRHEKEVAYSLDMCASCAKELSESIKVLVKDMRKKFGLKD